MISRCEIGLVISNIGKTYGIITDEIYTALILVIFMTTLLPPYLEIIRLMIPLVYCLIILGKKIVSLKTWFRIE